MVISFMEVLQADLNRMKNEWNRHRIRANKVNTNGIPCHLNALGPKHQLFRALLLALIACMREWGRKREREGRGNRKGRGVRTLSIHHCFSGP
jgi:hypothetical protein